MEIDYKFLATPKILNLNNVLIGSVYVEGNKTTSYPDGLSYSIIIKFEKSRWGFDYRTKVELVSVNRDDLPDLPLVTLGKSLGPSLGSSSNSGKLNALLIKNHVGTFWNDYVRLAKEEIEDLKKRFERFERFESMTAPNNQHIGTDMKITLASISEELDHIAQELQTGEKVALSPLQEEYQDYFQELLEIHDLKGLSGAEEAKLKAFFTDVSKGWTKGEGAK